MTFEITLETTLRRVVREELRSILAELPNRNEDRRVTYAEAAAAAGVSPATIRTWADAGRLRRYGDGRGVRFALAEVLAVHPEPKTAAESDEEWARKIRARHG